MKKLTVKQERFINIYSGNATEAAIQAGYSPKTAYAIGQENLRKPEIWQAIQGRISKFDVKEIATREERQRFWTTTMNDSTASMSDRLRASELLGKSQADFTEIHEHKGEVEVTHKIEVVDLDARATEIIRGRQCLGSRN